jgi:hypothetical protein
VNGLERLPEPLAAWATRYLPEAVGQAPEAFLDALDARVGKSWTPTSPANWYPDLEKAWVTWGESLAPRNSTLAPAVAFWMAFKQRRAAWGIVWGQQPERSGVTGPRGKATPAWRGSRWFTGDLSPQHPRALHRVWTQEARAETLDSWALPFLEGRTDLFPALLALAPSGLDAQGYPLQDFDQRGQRDHLKYLGQDCHTVGAFFSRPNRMVPVPKRVPGSGVNVNSVSPAAVRRGQAFLLRVTEAWAQQTGDVQALLVAGIWTRSWSHVQQALKQGARSDRPDWLLAYDPGVCVNTPLWDALGNVAAWWRASPKDVGHLDGNPEGRVLKEMLTHGGTFSGQPLSMIRAQKEDVVAHHLRALVEKWGFDPNLPNAAGVLPLVEAAQQGAVPMVYWLLDHAAQPDLADGKGQSLASLAAWPGVARTTWERYQTDRLTREATAKHAQAIRAAAPAGLRSRPGLRRS